MTKQLSDFLPNGSEKFIQRWIDEYPLKIIISKPRKSKLGDYRYLPKYKGHQITINNDLSLELFLLTLTHEIAHMHAFVKYGMKINPHGNEWKSIFKKLLIQTFSFYQADNQKELAKYAKNPSATLSSFPELSKCLMKNKIGNYYYLDELNEGELFIVNGKILKKGNLRRTRYLCEEYNAKKRYLVTGSAQVLKFNLADGK